MYFDTLEADDAINARAAVGEVQDEPEFWSDNEEEVEFVELKGKGKMKEKKKEKDQDNGNKKEQGTVLTKAYKTEVPLHPLPQKNQVINLLNQISAHLDPAAQQRHDDEQAGQNFQLVYLQLLQSQLQDEQRRREQAEAQVHEMELQLVHLKSQCQRHYSSSRSRLPSHSYSYSHHHCHRNRSQSHSHHFQSYSHHSQSHSHHSQSRSHPDSHHRYPLRSHNKDPYSCSGTPISWPSTPPPKTISYPSPSGALEHSSPTFADSGSNESILPSSSPALTPPTVTTKSDNGGVVASSLKLNLENLASVAAHLPQLGPMDVVSIHHDQEPGYFNVTLVSPSKKLHLSRNSDNK
ncbi:hypothetical protein GYMLUDRAFT_265319 [Collybiopsis luxurians FD-317 M1]|uniref:Uncharacterized protein n=1 Tax=Collybiopsis luxurians FD-317 M1 TaxID=944289 RepID=A0A0D0CCQ2_9AGAR|nr:hypothetical protein GYMLUDRAFT_265319 [Collybiopsis luxurians FD-317 M1]